MRRHHHLYLSILVPSISVLVGSTAYAQGTTETVLKVHRPGGETGWGIALFLDIDGENVGYLNRNDSKEFKLKSLDKGARTLHGAYWAYGFLTNDFGSRDLEAGEAHLICVEIGYDADNKKVFDVVETLAIELDDELKGVVTKKSPVYKLARGTEKTVEDTIRVTHSVTITDRKSVEGGLQAKSSVIEAGIKGGLSARPAGRFRPNPRRSDPCGWSEMVRRCSVSSGSSCTARARLP